jgi:hypothetical protein
MSQDVVEVVEEIQYLRQSVEALTQSVHYLIRLHEESVIIPPPLQDVRFPYELQPGRLDGSLGTNYSARNTIIQWLHEVLTEQAFSTSIMNYYRALVRTAVPEESNQTNYGFTIAISLMITITLVFLLQLVEKKRKKRRSSYIGNRHNLKVPSHVVPEDKQESDSQYSEQKDTHIDPCIQESDSKCSEQKNTHIDRGKQYFDDYVAKYEKNITLGHWISMFGDKPDSIEVFETYQQACDAHMDKNLWVIRQYLGRNISSPYVNEIISCPFGNSDDPQYHFMYSYVNAQIDPPPGSTELAGVFSMMVDTGSMVSIGTKNALKNYQTIYEDTVRSLGGVTRLTYVNVKMQLWDTPQEKGYIDNNLKYLETMNVRI